MRARTEMLEVKKEKTIKAVMKFTK
jgi:hypothetical protein